MPIEPAYVTELPWDSQRPEAVVITCVDGRWYRHFQEFAKVRLEAGPCTDFMAVPGGIEPMTLADDVPKDFNFFRRPSRPSSRPTARAASSSLPTRTAHGISRGWRRRPRK